MVSNTANTGAVDGNPTAVDVDVLPCEAPVPNHRDCSETRRELKVSGRILLRPSPEADITAKKGQIAKEATRPVFHYSSQRQNKKQTYWRFRDCDLLNIPTAVVAPFASDTGISK